MDVSENEVTLYSSLILNHRLYFFRHSDPYKNEGKREEGKKHTISKVKQISVTQIGVYV